MGSQFGDLADYFKPGLTLTILGEEYEIPLPSAELGLWCRRVADLAGAVSDNSTAEEAQEAADRAADLPDLPGNMSFTERLLGKAYLEMLDRGVPDPYVQFAGQTVYLWIVAGEDTAARFWQAGGRRPGEAEGSGNRAQRRAATSTSTGAATSTRPPASTSGTNSRRKSGKRGGRGRSPGATS